MKKLSILYMHHFELDFSDSFLRLHINKIKSAIICSFGIPNLYAQRKSFDPDHRLEHGASWNISFRASSIV